MRLLCARITPFQANQIASNPIIIKNFGKPVLLAQMYIDRFQEIKDLFHAQIFDTPIPSQPKEAFDLIRDIFRLYAITHVIASQKLLWYSNLIEQAASEFNAKILWCEPFFDEYSICDKSGLQYTRINDLVFDDRTPDVAPDLPRSTRQVQSSTGQADYLRDFYAEKRKDVIVTFGQVPHDMALVEYPGLKYESWLRTLFESNPNTVFLFKHHPLVSTPDIQNIPNVHVINDSIFELFNNFIYFAAFSSTTIFEGILRGCKFVTGGYHFLSGTNATLEASSRDSLAGVYEKLKNLTIDYSRLDRRIRFVCNEYVLSLSDEKIFHRLNLDSEKYFYLFRNGV